VAPARRTLLAAAALAALPSAALTRRLPPLRAYPREPLRIDDMAPGDWRLLMLSGAPVFVHRLAKASKTSGEWAVLSGVCPHAGCNVDPTLGEEGGLGCPCHGSRFDARGKLVRGPATRGLATPPHVIEAGMLTLL
jgi:Rieske Fe-S protein